MSRLLRGARLGSTKKGIVDFVSSLEADQRLLESVVKINKAHVVMMVDCKIVDQNKAAKLLNALNRIDVNADITKSDSEDVHMYVEEIVTESVGSEIGGDLHIGKSRNDQVATAIRMKLREDLVELIFKLAELQSSILTVAEKHVGTVVPGYTHTQPAQPITFAHYLLSFFDAFNRDIERLTESYERVNQSPMGAGALAGTSFPIDRERMAELLGFKEVMENSLDAVGSRDFLLEVQSCLTLAALNVTRLTEDLILWSSLAFGVIDLPDEFSSTSSMMPQKKNPEVLEVIRARMSHVAGGFLTTAMAMKSLPSGYNLDLQEITPILWETIECMSGSLSMLIALVPLLKISSASSNLLGFTTSTELANVLTRKYKVPFRSAHRIVGALVQELVRQKQSLSDTTSELLESVSTRVSGIPLKVSAEDIRSCADPSRVVEAHNVKGGPSPEEVKRTLKARAQVLEIWKDSLSKETDRLTKASDELQSLAEQYSTLSHGCSQGLRRRKST